MRHKGNRYKRTGGKNRITKIALSIDDGAYDSYTNILPLIREAHLPATFHIVTGYILRNNSLDWCRERGLFRQPMTPEQIYEMACEPLCELSSHSDDHSNNWESICKGGKELRKILSDTSDDSADISIGLASPGSKLSFEDLYRMESRLKEEGFFYARTALRIRSLAYLRILARKISRVFHSGYLYAFAYRDTLLDSNDTFALNSVPIMHDIKSRQVKELVRLAERKGENCILLLHSVMKPGESFYEDNWSWDLDRFRSLLAFLNEEQAAGRIRVVKVMELTDNGNDIYS